MIQYIKKTLHQNSPFYEFVRFCIVGVICTLLDAAIYYLLVDILPYEYSLTIAYCLSLVVNYLLTVTWTFKQKATSQNAIGVVGAHLVNLFIVRMGLMHVFMSVGLTEKVAYIPTLLISMVTNYIIVRFVVKRFS